MAALLPASCVALRGTLGPAAVSVGYGESIWDALWQLRTAAPTTSRRWRSAFFEAQHACLVESLDTRVALYPPGSLLQDKGLARELRATIPFARATPSLPDTVARWGLSVACPVAELNRHGRRLPERHPRPRLSVVVLLSDSVGRLLLTRRTPHMRTFPSCWVFPGGAVDDDEGLLDAGAREVFEETGLSVPASCLRLLCAWESVYPTSYELCLQEGQVKGHTLVAYLTGTVAQQEMSRLQLQRAECDMCAWMPLSELAVLHGESHPGNHIDRMARTTLCWRIADSGLVGEASIQHDHMSDLIPVELSPTQLHGIYPNEIGEGIGQGHLFSIVTLLAERDRGARL